MNQLTRHRLPNLKSTIPAPLHVQEADLDLAAMIRLLRRRAWFIAIFTLVLTLLTLPAILATKKVFYAETRFLIQQPLSEPKPGEGAVLAPENEVERLRSRDIARQVVARFRLDERPEFNPALTPPSLFRAALAMVRPDPEDATPSAEGETVEQHVLNAVDDRVRVWRQGESVILVGFKSSDPQLAADVSNAMVDFYVADREARQRGRLEAAVDRVQARVAAQRERLAEASATVRAYQKEHGVTTVGGIGSLDDSRLRLKTEQLADMQRRRADLHGQIETMDAAIADDGPPPPDATGTLGELRQSLVQQQRDLARLTASYGDGYGGVATARARIAETQEAIKTELRGLRGLLQVEDDRLATDERVLQRTRDALETKLSRTSIAELELARLMRRADARSEVLDQLEEEQRQLQDMTASPVLDLEMLSEATPPVNPVSRSKKLYLLMAMVAASALAMTAAGVLELTDRSVRSHQQLAGLPGAIPVGMLPETAHPERAGTAAGDQRMSDALRGVLLSLEVLEDGIPQRSLLVTTAGPREGARVVARGLARHLVNGSTGVLVVEAVAPRGLFGHVRKSGPRGLAEYLRKDGRLADLIHQDPATKVHILSYGNGSLTPLHDRTPVQRIIDYASARNLTVIFVCPPVLTSASTLQIAATVDRVLLVMRWGVTPLERVSLSLNRLRSGGVETAATLLNRVDPRRHALYSFRDAAAFPKSARADVW